MTWGCKVSLSFIIAWSLSTASSLHMEGVVSVEIQDMQILLDFQRFWQKKCNEAKLVCILLREDEAHWLTGHHWVEWATKQSEEEEECWLQTGSARYPEFTVKIFCRSALICVPPILLLHRALICSRENKPCVLLWRVRCQLSGIEVWVVKSVWRLLICVLTMADNFMNIEQKVTHWDSF